MICKKDAEEGEFFWSAVTADRVILPDGKMHEQLTYEPKCWYLCIADSEYWLYPADELEHIACNPDSRLTVYPVGEPYAIYDKSRYDYKVKDNIIEIVENRDNVSHPPYYAEGWGNGAEVIDLTEHLSFCAGNVVKYVCRAGRKDPDKYVEDLKKARWYLDREIGRVEKR